MDSVYLPIRDAWKCIHERVNIFAAVSSIGAEKKSRGTGAFCLLVSASIFPILFSSRSFSSYWGFLFALLDCLRMKAMALSISYLRMYFHEFLGFLIRFARLSLHENYGSFHFLSPPCTFMSSWGSESRFSLAMMTKRPDSQLPWTFLFQLVVE